MEKSAGVFYWMPRILCILAILFVSMFALDAFNPQLSVWQQIRDFLIHLIPSFVLLALLLVAWKWEYVGGIIFTALGIGLSPFVFFLNYNRGHLSILQCLMIILIITIPFALVGILFIVGAKKKNRHQRLHQVKGL